MFLELRIRFGFPGAEFPEGRPNRGGENDYSGHFSVGDGNTWEFGPGGVARLEIWS